MYTAFNFLEFCKTDHLIHTSLTKIIGIIHALKVTFHRWYTIMILGWKSPQPLPIPKHDFSMLKVKSTAYQLYLELPLHLISINGGIFLTSRHSDLISRHNFLTSRHNDLISLYYYLKSFIQQLWWLVRCHVDLSDNCCYL